MEKVTQNVPDTGCTDPDEFVNDLCIEAIEDEAQVSERNENIAMATIQKRQALRLKESLDD